MNRFRAALLTLTLLLPALAVPDLRADQKADLAAARRLFAANPQAIRDKAKDAPLPPAPLRPALPVPDLRADQKADLAAARRLFEANLQAIRDKDKDAYLACYLQSDQLVRTGPAGVDLGYAGLAATA